MRGVSKGFRRSAALVVLITVFAAQTAAAKGHKEGWSWRLQFQQAKRFVVTVLGRFGWPPGQPVDDPAEIVPAESTPTTEG